MTERKLHALSAFLRVKHGYAFKGEFFAESGDHVLLTPGNFSLEGGLKLKGDKEKYYTGPIPPEFVLERGDLIVAMTDLIQNAPILGAPAFIPESGRFLHNQRLGKIVGLKADELDKRYLYFAMETEDFRAQIRATATGSTVRHTAPERIYAAKIPVPPLKIQKRVAGILAAYDELIENNTRRIAILEETSRTLYHEWFVEFRFPGCDGSKFRSGKIGLYPEGWTIHPLEDLSLEIRDSVDPREIESSIPYFGLEHLPRRSIALDAWGMASDVQSSKLRVARGDIIFSKIRPYFHKVGVSPVDAVCSSDAIVLRPKNDDVYGLVLSCVSSDAFIAHASQTSQGTKMPRASWKVLREYLLMRPPDDLLKVLNAQVLRSVELIRALCLTNRNLRSTRDLLLPKLISGELDVSHLPDPDLSVG